MLIAVFYIIKNVTPIYTSLAERKANAIAISISNKATNETTKNINYSDLIEIEKNNDGDISMIKANTYVMNKLSSEISNAIERELNALNEKDNSYIFIPLGSMFGNKILMNVGPKIKVKLLPVGSFNISFKNEFESTGINQTLHKIYVEIICKGTIVTPFSNQTSTFKNTVLISEVIIIGEVPNTFYNIEGVSDLKETDSMNLMN